jgi:hypothetical protein
MEVVPFDSRLCGQQVIAFSVSAIFFFYGNKDFFFLSQNEEKLHCLCYSWHASFSSGLYNTHIVERHPCWH